MNNGGIFQRTSLLLGDDVLARLHAARVIVFGVGGVGSWCAEGLVRSGIRKLTIVDCDRVNETNINRQLMATTLTIGQEKTEAMKRRLLEINPDAEIEAVCREYSAETAGDFDLDSYDYVIDAIDTLRNKVELICRASEASATLYCSLGAALKVDPRRIKVGNFWKVRDCPLGAALRKKIRQSGRIPEHSFLCVYGDELLQNRGETPEMRPALLEEAARAGKAVLNGSVVHITSIFGMTLAGLVVQDIYNKTLENHGR